MANLQMSLPPALVLSRIRKLSFEHQGTNRRRS
jgi:hypothetical protein